MRSPVTILAIGAALAVAGCGSDDFARRDGLTEGAGNAMAANNAMQMVDPWMRGVENPRLRVPAERADAAPQGGGQAGGSAGKTTDN